MPNFQPFIDNIHLILPGVAMVMFAFYLFASAMGKRNPEPDWWDKQAERSKWVLEQYQWGLDQLVRLGAGKWTGAEKLAESVARTKRFEDLWAQGKYIEALSEVTGFRQSVMSKLEKAGASQLPFAQSQNQAITTPPPQDQTSVRNQIAPAAEDTAGSGMSSTGGSGVIGSQLAPALDKVRAAVRK